jgi:endonuclease/exonuclease/phosphatase family metal-dependent hydrolase
MRDDIQRENKFPNLERQRESSVSFDIRIVTFNISGGEKTYQDFPNDSPKARQEALSMLIKQMDADVLCLQEVSQYIDADGKTHSMTDGINAAGGYEHMFYGKTVSMESHMQVKKDVMVKGIFNDWWNWSKGNSIHSRFPFSRLGDPEKNGVPRSIPLYMPPSYEGTRDTEPRFALLARLKQSPFPYITSLHLTTLVGERNPKSSRKKIEQSHLMRYEQVQRILDLVRVHILETQQPLILAGDFNAMMDEFGIKQLLSAEEGFIRLRPDVEIPTHPGIKGAIDHIFFFPRERLVDYGCRIDNSELSQRASDHLPVIAEVQIK